MSVLQVKCIVICFQSADRLSFDQDVNGDVTRGRSFNIRVAIAKCFSGLRNIERDIYLRFSSVSVDVIVLNVFSEFRSFVYILMQIWNRATLVNTSLNSPAGVLGVNN